VWLSVRLSGNPRRLRRGRSRRFTGDDPQSPQPVRPSSDSNQEGTRRRELCRRCAGGARGIDLVPGRNAVAAIVAPRRSESAQHLGDRPATPDADDRTDDRARAEARARGACKVQFFPLVLPQLPHLRLPHDARFAGGGTSLIIRRYLPRDHYSHNQDFATRRDPPGRLRGNPSPRPAEEVVAR
jgi:hypothetical protein